MYICAHTVYICGALRGFRGKLIGCGEQFSRTRRLHRTQESQRCSWRAKVAHQVPASRPQGLQDRSQQRQLLESHARSLGVGTQINPPLCSHPPVEVGSLSPLYSHASAEAKKKNIDHCFSLRGKQRRVCSLWCFYFRMAEPRFNNPYFWPPPPAMPGQVSDCVSQLISHTLVLVPYVWPGLRDIWMKHRWPLASLTH